MKNTSHCKADEARERIRICMDEFMSKVTPWNLTWRQTVIDNDNIPLRQLLLLKDRPPRYLVKVPPGIGKTTIVFDKITSWMRTGTAGQVIIFAPTHDLINEYENLLSSSGFQVRQYHGLLQPDPNDNSYKMCRRPDEAQTVMAAHGSIETRLCGSRRDPPEERCIFFKQCGFQKQKAAKNVHIWLAPHNLLFMIKPKFFPDPALVVVDESSVDASLFGFDRAPPCIDIDDLDRYSPLEDVPEQKEKLRFASRSLKSLMKSCNGVVTAAALEDASVSAEDAANYQVAAYSLKSDLTGIHPRSQPEKIRLCGRI